MKAFRTFTRRKSDRIDVLRLHQIASSFRANLTPQLETFFSSADDYLFTVAQSDDPNADDFLDQLNQFRSSKPDIITTISSELDSWFDWKEGERKSLEDIEAEKQLAADTEWSLMEDHSLEKSLAIERFSSRVIRSSNHQWDMFFNRISVLTADNTLTENESPFNPTRLGSIVFEAIDETDLNFKVKSLVFRVFDDTVSTDVTQFFEQQNEWLAQEGILPNLQATDFHTQRPKKADINTIDTITHSLGSGSGEGVVIDPAVLENLMTSINALQSKNQDIPDVTDLDAVQQWANKQASTVTQQFKGSDKSEVIALVSMLFDYFFEDGQLAAQMKHLLARMQIPIIKVAILDKTFFENSSHPARMLVNKMARAASHWQANDNLENDMLREGMENIVFRLSEEFVDDISLFDELLVVFEALKKNYEEARDKALEELRLAEEKALAENESQDRARLFLTQILDEAILPTDITEMLQQDWYRLMRLILLKQGDNRNWRNSARIGKELVWSLQPAVQTSAGERFDNIVPKMLNGLEDGLRAIGKSDEFIQNLLVSIAKQQGEYQRSPQQDGISQSEQETIHRLDVQMRGAEQLIDGPLPLLIEEPDVDQVPADVNFYLAIIETFEEGMWFTYSKLDDTTERVCLSMIVADGGKFVFSDTHGHKVLERSSIGLSMALRKNQLVQLDDEELVERTLKTLAEKISEQN
jgi:hypothetical protein